MKRVLPLLTGLIALAFSQSPQPAQPQRTISVTGTADVALVSDVCVMNMVINVNRQPDAASAFAEIKAQAKKLTEALKAQSVSPKDVESQGITLRADNRASDRSKVTFFDDYTVTQTLQVKVRDLAKIPAIFDAVLGTDAKVQSVAYTGENEERAYAKPRLDAIQQARDRAEAICQATGLKLIKPISVSERTGEDWGGGRYPDMSQAGQQGGLQLEPTVRKLSMSVSITYEVE